MSLMQWFSHKMTDTSRKAMPSMKIHPQFWNVLGSTCPPSSPVAPLVRSISSAYVHSIMTPQRRCLFLLLFGICCCASANQSQRIQQTRGGGAPNLFPSRYLKVSVSDEGLLSICAPISWNTAGWIVVFMLMLPLLFVHPFIIISMHDASQ